MSWLGGIWGIRKEDSNYWLMLNENVVNLSVMEIIEK